MDIILTDEVKKYIKALSSTTEQAQIYQYLERQEELGHRLKEPVSKPLEHGINEMRPGPHRFLFFYERGQIIVIHVFRKKTQKIPDYELKTAIRKRDQWRQHE